MPRACEVQAGLQPGMGRLAEPPTNKPVRFWPANIEPTFNALACSAKTTPKVPMATRAPLGPADGRPRSVAPSTKVATSCARCAAACRRPSCLCPCSRLGSVVCSSCRLGQQPTTGGHATQAKACGTAGRSAGCASGNMVEAAAAGRSTSDVPCTAASACLLGHSSWAEVPSMA